MARYQILSWRDIPAQVIVFDEAGQVSGVLPPRFQKAIDAAAMAAGAADPDAYLAGWRKGAVRDRPGAAPAVLEALLMEIEAACPPETLSKLARQGGNSFP